MNIIKKPEEKPVHEIKSKFIAPVEKKNVSKKKSADRSRFSGLSFLIFIKTKYFKEMTNRINMKMLEKKEPKIKLEREYLSHF